MLQEGGEGLHAPLQGGVGRLHLAAEPGDHRHGRVERVLVDHGAVIADEGQHAVEPAGLEHRPGLPGAHQLQHLETKETWRKYSRIRPLGLQWGRLHTNVKLHFQFFKCRVYK